MNDEIRADSSKLQPPPMFRSRWRIALWTAALLIASSFIVLSLVGPLAETRIRGQRLSVYLRAFAHDGVGFSSQPPFGLVGTFQPSPERTRAWEVLPES